MDVKIKRFTDTDMRHVLRRVREDQGPDAVILSNRRVEGGIEVITAIDYDEALMQHALGSSPVTDPAKPGVPSKASAPLQKKREESIPAKGNVDAPVELLSADLDGTIVDDSKIVDVDDGPSLAAMQSEISSLRGLLETQLSDLVWKDGARTAPARAQILRNLSRIGIAPDIANMIVNRLPPITDRKQLWRAPLTSLAQLIPVVDDPLVKQGGVAALIGPTGVGKTTTIAKIAARYAMSYGSDEIALISADAYRIGAREHLTAFGNIIGVSVQSAANSAELGDLLDRFSNKKLVLIDTEGTSQRDRALSDRLAAYGDNADRVKFYLTLSAANQESGLDETIRKFSSVPLAGSIITKVDEAGQLGCILSALVRHDLKAAYLSDGQRVPDDLYKANKKKLWLVNQAVDCVRNSAPVVDERIMAESFGHVSAAHG
jgi:flagellar biosynthesis protein FlhF